MKLRFFATLLLTAASAFAQGVSHTGYSADGMASTSLRGSIVSVEPAPLGMFKVVVNYSGNASSKTTSMPPLAGLAVGSSQVGASMTGVISMGNNMQDLGVKAGSFTGTIGMENMGGGNFRGKLRLTVGATVKEAFFYSGAMYTFYLNLSNNKNVPVFYQITQSGNEIGGIYLNPGESRIQTFKTTDSTDITVNERPQSYSFNSSTGTTDISPPSTTPSSSHTYSTSDSGTSTAPKTVPPSPPPPGGATNDPLPDGSQAGDGVVWQSNDGKSSALSESTFKDGVAQIVKAVKSSGGGSGGSTDVSGVESRLDQIKAKIEENHNSWFGDDAADFSFDSTTTELFVPTASQASSAAGRLGAPPAITAPGNSFNGHLVVNLTLPKVGAVSIDADTSQYSTQINVFKALVRAALGVLFYLAVVRAFRGAFA